jgi:CelD/BcsL family acetyltransferase involved in cellulose biosynthesis
MHAEEILITELPENLKQQWLKIQASNPNLAGPCFHPELFIIRGHFCSYIRVVILYRGKNVLAFWPFLKDQESLVAKPIRFCDYSAIIKPRFQHLDMSKIMKKTGLMAWEFMALSNFDNIDHKTGVCEYADSPRVDLTEGFEKYLDSQKHRKAGYKDIVYKKRLVERTLGPLRFVPICNDVDVLHRMLSWKKDRYHMPSDWMQLTTGFLEQIFYLKGSPFSGVLSALYAGDKLIAASFCLRYQGILHGTSMSYDPEFKKYSPGSLLLSSLISRLYDLQCTILDFGPGQAEYKYDFANKFQPVIRGSFKLYSLKETIKSIDWLYSGIKPFVRARRRIINSLFPRPLPI